MENTDPWYPLVREFKKRCVHELEGAFHLRRCDATHVHHAFFDKFLAARNPHAFRVWNSVTWMMLEMKVGEEGAAMTNEDSLWSRHIYTLPDPSLFNLGIAMTRLDCCEMLLGLQRKRNYTQVPCDNWDHYWNVQEEMVTATILRHRGWRNAVPSGMMSAAMDIARLSRALDVVCEECADVVVHPQYSYHLQALESPFRSTSFL